MKFLIEEIKNKETWEDFLSECEEKTFLQSWNWGEFQKAMGNKVWRVGLLENEKILASALTIKIQARRGTFLFLPHGPVIRKQETENRKQILRELMDELRKIAKEEKASFIRISPIWPARRLVRRSLAEGGSHGEDGEKNEENSKIFKDSGFKEAPLHIHPELTWELDLTPPEETLLLNMRKTTRYLIRQAQKNPDIKIERSEDISGVVEFNKLYQETVDRHHFVAFPLDYLKKQFQAFSNDKQISVFLGKYKDEIVSSGIFVFWQNIAFYHHGSSSQKYPKIPVSYLLQWEAVREAKRKGCQRYNFWGIAPEEKRNHPWHGLSLFKMGFGGYQKEYVKTQDFPLSKKYWLTFIFEKLRKTKRGL